MKLVLTILAIGLCLMGCRPGAAKGLRGAGKAVKGVSRAVKNLTKPKPKPKPKDNSASNPFGDLSNIGDLSDLGNLFDDRGQPYSAEGSWKITRSMVGGLPRLHWRTQPRLLKTYVGHRAAVLSSAFGQPYSWKKEGVYFTYTYKMWAWSDLGIACFFDARFVVKPDPVKGGGTVMHVFLYRHPLGGGGAF